MTEEEKKERRRDAVRRCREKHREEYNEKAREYMRKRRAENKERAREISKRYYEKHREEVIERSLEYVKNNKEKVKERQSRYYQKNREKFLLLAAEYRESNKDKRKEYWIKNRDVLLQKHKEYVEKNKEHIQEYRKEYNKNYFASKNGRAATLASVYRNFDIGRGFSAEECVDSNWIVENIFSGQKCVYCGDSDWSHLGCDRIDNSKGHTPENVVCSCGICNMDKCDRYSVEEFVEYRKTHPRELSSRLKPFVVENKNGVNVLKKVDLDFS